MTSLFHRQGCFGRLARLEIAGVSSHSGRIGRPPGTGHYRSRTARVAAPCAGSSGSQARASVRRIDRNVLNLLEALADYVFKATAT